MAFSPVTFNILGPCAHAHHIEGCSYFTFHARAVSIVTTSPEAEVRRAVNRAYSEQDREVMLCSN